MMSKDLSPVIFKVVQIVARHILVEVVQIRLDAKVAMTVQVAKIFTTESRFAFMNLILVHGSLASTTKE